MPPPNRWHVSLRRDLAVAQGTFHFASGDLYQGEFAHDLRQGSGTLWRQSGSVYRGAFSGGEMFGVFTKWCAGNGEAIVMYMNCTDEPEGAGAKWNATRDRAWGLYDDVLEGEISLEEAAQIAGELGLDAPPTTKKPPRPAEQLRPRPAGAAGAGKVMTQQAGSAERPKLKPKQRRVKVEPKPRPHLPSDVRRRIVMDRMAR